MSFIMLPLSHFQSINIIKPCLYKGCKRPVDDGHEHLEFIKCTSCTRYGHRNTNCPEQSHPPTPRQIITPVVRSVPIHSIGQMLVIISCKNCHQQGHTTSECPHNPHLATPMRPTITTVIMTKPNKHVDPAIAHICKTCNKPVSTHGGFECPITRTHLVKYCSKCNQRGHEQSACPNVPASAICSVSEYERQKHIATATAMHDCRTHRHVKFGDVRVRYIAPNPMK